MKAKKTVLATAVLMTMGAGAAEATVSSFTYTGMFTMYNGDNVANHANFATVPPYGYLGTLHSGDFAGSGVTGAGPTTGTMDLDFAAGTGSATILATTTFFGYMWQAEVTSMTRGYTEAGYTPNTPATNWHTNILFGWGAGDVGANPCNMTNCDIHVSVDWDIHDDGAGNYTFATVGSWMVDGPFVTFQPTFTGTLTAVPVPATAWMVGSGLIGLIGVGRARRKRPRDT